jgi:hypothetical protein
MCYAIFTNSHFTQMVTIKPLIGKKPIKKKELHIAALFFVFP